MTDEDFPVFEAVMQKFRFVFRVRMSTDEFATLCATYFKALQHFSMADLQAGADRYVEHGKGFPRPAEWRADVPRRDRTVSTWPLATDLEVQAYRDAQRLHYEDVPCPCKWCAAAGVSELTRRYVPDVLSNGEDRRLRDAKTGQTFIIGHWAHGEELALWHLARERFYEEMQRWTKAPATRDAMTSLLALVPKVLPP